MPRWVPIALLLAAAAWSVRGLRGFPLGGRHVPPLTVGPTPVQEELPGPVDVPITRDGAAYTLRQTHHFRVVGEVLSASTYTFAFANDFFDVDLGLAWGTEVERLKSTYTFYQDHRWLFWRSAGPVSDAERATITASIGNEHLIPATPRIDRAIRWADVGDIVAIEGSLVTVLGADGRVLTRSSTSRTDTGAGACEVIQVTRFQNGDTVWE
jgi:hypothetical protein